MRKSVPKLLTGILSLTLLITPALATSTFPDVDEDAVYAPAVEYLSDVGIMEGDGKGNFNPDATVTRGEMAAIVCRLLGETEDLPNDERFPDVPTTHWANAYVSKAAELGIVNGYDNGNFGPADTVTLEQALAMIIRGTVLDEIAIDAGGYPYGYIETASDYRLTDLISAQKGDFLTRWEVAMILYNSMIM